MNIYYVYDEEINKAEGHFFAENDAFAKRRFMLNLKSFPEEIRGCFVLYRLCEIVADGMSVIPSGEVVCSGLDFDGWLKSHSKEIK